MPALITFRCTRRVLKRYGWTPQDARESTSRLGDWYVNLLNLGPERWVLCVSDRTLLPVIVPARKDEFPARFGAYLEFVLEALEVPRHHVVGEVESVENFVVSRTESRQVLGVMTDFANLASYHGPGSDPVALALKLAGAPSKPLEYQSPGRRTRELFGVEGRWRHLLP